MNHYILHAGLDAKPVPLIWQYDLATRGIVVLRVGRLEEMIQVLNSYQLAMVLIDIPSPCDGLIEAMTAVRSNVNPAHLCPMIGLHRDPLEESDRIKVAAAGLDDLFAHSDPERFILWKLDTLINLLELRQFQQTRLDVASLAVQTREQLHDLSQPLSAIQGRLQLLAAKCPSDDPNAECLKDLVRLIFEVSKQVTEIHHLHRRFG